MELDGSRYGFTIMAGCPHPSPLTFSTVFLPTTVLQNNLKDKAPPLRLLIKVLDYSTLNTICQRFFKKN
jgi:hypothetical protein